MEVKKSQHKYVIGPKGNSLQEILERTGVSVEIPPSDSASETVILRGEPEKLGQALTEVYAKVTSPAVTGPGWGCREHSPWQAPRPGGRGTKPCRPMGLFPGSLGQQFHRLLRLCSLLAPPFHHRQERAEPGQNHSADAKGEGLLSALPGGWGRPLSSTGFVLGVPLKTTGGF